VKAIGQFGHTDAPTFTGSAQALAKIHQLGNPIWIRS
jgi:hypothetical protein